MEHILFVLSEVLPASAGMILSRGTLHTGILCAPRIRGDDPRRGGGAREGHDVLPASAGMILLLLLLVVWGPGAPRIRGDDPIALPLLIDHMPCSPHPRG